MKKFTFSKSLETFFSRKQSPSNNNIKNIIKNQKNLINIHEQKLISKDFRYFQMLRTRDEESRKCLCSLVNIQQIVNISNEERQKIEKELEKMKEKSEENLNKKIKEFQDKQREHENKMKSYEERYKDYEHKIKTLEEENPKLMAEVNDFLKYKEILQTKENIKQLKKQLSKLQDNQNENDSDLSET